MDGEIVTMHPGSDHRRRLLRRGSRCRLEVLRLDDRWLPSSGYGQINLASDVPGLARVTDPHLVNPWGISFSPTGPLWFAENGTSVSDLLDGRGRTIPLVVGVPAGGSPSGTVFNGGPGFLVSKNGVSHPGRFLFATEDGVIAGWSALVDPSHALVAVDNSAAGAVYKGLALATDSTGATDLYAADFHRGEIDVFDGDFRPIVHPGAFRDPNLPAGFAPFNIQSVNGRLFVTYARQNAARHDDVAGPGNGVIDVYDADGNLLQRFAAGGALDSPWGLALAPAGFGPFGGTLLIGNNGDGHINAFNPMTGAFLGTLTDDAGNPIASPGLWALKFGNDHLGGAGDTLFFTAGIDNETHGLFGAIQSPQRRGTDTAGAGGFDPHAPGEPGDYPLPPTTGPALQDRLLDTSFATAVLLPPTPSSLALAPTLSVNANAAVRVESGAPTMGQLVSAPAAIGTTRLSGAAPGSAADDDAPAVKPEVTNPIPLYAFLDLNPAAMRSSVPPDDYGPTVAGSDAVIALVSPAETFDAAADHAGPPERDSAGAENVAAWDGRRLRSRAPALPRSRAERVGLLGSVLGAISFPVIYAIHKRSARDC